MLDSEQIRLAVAQARSSIAGSGARGAIAAVAQKPDVVIDIANQRAVRVYSHLTRQTTGPIRQTQSVVVHQGAVEQLEGAWLEGWLTAAVAIELHDPLTLPLLAEAARTLDSISEEHGFENVWARLDITEQPVHRFSVAYGEAHHEALRKTDSPLPGAKRFIVAALASLWQDGFAIAALAASLLARADAGEGPRPEDDAPNAEF